MNKARYLLKTPTLAILACGDYQRIPITIPNGSVVEVEVELNGNRLVDVNWDGKTVMMFSVDIRTRGELMTPKAASVGGSERRT